MSFRNTDDVCRQIVFYDSENDQGDFVVMPFTAEEEAEIRGVPGSSDWEDLSDAELDDDQILLQMTPHQAVKRKIATPGAPVKKLRWSRVEDDE